MTETDSLAKTDYPSPSPSAPLEIRELSPEQSETKALELLVCAGFPESEESLQISLLCYGVHARTLNSALSNCRRTAAVFIAEARRSPQMCAALGLDATPEPPALPAVRRAHPSAQRCDREYQAHCGGLHRRSAAVATDVRCARPRRDARAPRDTHEPRALFFRLCRKVPSFKLNLRHISKKKEKRTEWRASAQQQYEVRLLVRHTQLRPHAAPPCPFPAVFFAPRYTFHHGERRLPKSAQNDAALGALLREWELQSSTSSKAAESVLRHPSATRRTARALPPPTPTPPLPPHRAALKRPRPQCHASTEAGEDMRGRLLPVH